MRYYIGYIDNILGTYDIILGTYDIILDTYDIRLGTYDIILGNPTQPGGGATMAPPMVFPHKIRKNNYIGLIFADFS